MLSSNSTFDAVHALAHKDPNYLVRFDGEPVDYVFWKCRPNPTWDLLLDYGSSLTGWSDGSAGNGTVSIYDSSKILLHAHAAAATNYARISRDIGEFPNYFTLRAVLYHSNIGAIADGDHFLLRFNNGTKAITLAFCSDGLFVADDAGWSEVGANIVTEAAWQYWLAAVNWVEKICDIWLYDATHNWARVAANVPCDYTLAGTSGGVNVYQFGQTTSDQATYVDSIFIGTGGWQEELLADISGMDQKKTPEEGKSSIGGTRFELLDKDDAITELLATDTDAYFDNRKVTVKGGYRGLAEEHMLTIAANHRVNAIKANSDLTGYVFSAADPQKKLQKEIFRGADESTAVIVGSAINIILRVLTSSGTPGANGSYDVYAAAWGVDMDSTEVDIDGIESMRDDYFPVSDYLFYFEIDEAVTAKDWLEKEFYKVLNITPFVRADGRYTLKPNKPPVVTSDDVQSLDEDVIEGLPKWDANLPSKINEIDVRYDHDGSDYQTTEYHQDTDSLTNRDTGKKVLKIKSKGLHTTISGSSIPTRAADIVSRRVRSLFSRWAQPPNKLTFETLFYSWLSDAGDVAPVTHSEVPDIVAGVRGISERRMEITQRSPDWSDGRVKFTLLDTGFAKGTYQVISPTMTITAVTDRENFTVSPTDAAKYAGLSSPEVQICAANMVQRVDAVTILAVDTSTGAIQIDNAGLDLSAGWIVLFADYDNCTSEQKQWGFIADSSNELGAANDAAHLIVP